LPWQMALQCYIHTGASGPGPWYGGLKVDTWVSHCQHHLSTLLPACSHVTAVWLCPGSYWHANGLLTALYGVWPVHPPLCSRGLFESSWTINHPAVSSASACHPLLLGISTELSIS
jgi:hypothetical protein